ncbi:C39 family peptidase [Candidatus Campbellbacteria bacterium]|nr:MAG: C39 family peptidase [Candidatus Campbellbacteria bacterium]
MRLDIPFISQYDARVPESWRPRACSVTNLYMVLSFFNTTENVTTTSLIQEGESIGAYGPRGWTHEGIVRLARNHGIRAYAQEFRSSNTTCEEKLTTEGIEKIKEVLASGCPTIVSVQKENGSYHTITVVGESDVGFLCHDPEIGEYQEVSLETFLKRWRKLAIFFEV